MFFEPPRDPPVKAYESGLLFERTCPSCGRFVRADHHVMVNGLDEVSTDANANCSSCGRVTMPFVGWSE